MSKPLWDEAPEWAGFLALDPDGRWYWYELEPEWDTRWENQRNSRMKYAGDGISSYDSLESRP